MNQLHQTQVLVQAQYELARQSLHKVLAKETALRNELLRLDTMEKSTRYDADGDHRMRTIGADIIWQSWLERKKVDLNMELARVLARKEPLLAGVKRAYGKVLVVAELIVEKDKKRNRKAQNLALGKVIEHALSQRASNLDARFQ